MNTQTFPGLSLQDDQSVLASEWQARTFALALQCHASGAFSWSEWADELSCLIAEFEQELAVVGSDDY